MKNLAIICLPLSLMTACDQNQHPGQEISGKIGDSSKAYDETEPVTGAAELMSEQDLNDMRHMAEQGSGWAYIVLAQEAERQGDYTKASQFRQNALSLRDPSEILRRIAVEIRQVSANSNTTNDCIILQNAKNDTNSVIESIDSKTIGMSLSSIDNLKEWSANMKSNINILIDDRC